MIKLAISGSIFAAGGRFRHGRTKHQIARLVEAAGGEFLDQISARADCFIAGSHARGKLDRARARGLIIIDEDQLQELVELGEIEIDDSPTIDQDFDFGRAVSELRSALDGPPTSGAWTDILEIFERCDPARVEHLVAYAKPFLDRWDTLALPPWDPPREHDLMEHETPEWRACLPTDELRVAPPGWLLEMARESYSPKHSIVRALNLEGMRINSTIGQRILDNPHLQQITWLNLGGRNKFTKTFYSRLRQRELVRSITELWLYTYDDMLRDGFSAPEHHFDSLQTIRFDRWTYPHVRKATLPPCLQGATIKKTY